MRRFTSPTAFNCAECHSGDIRPVIVIMISVDGYRWDYLYEPGFSLDIVTRMIRKGVGATLVPVFPSQGTPNHYSIGTECFSQKFFI